MAGNLESKMIGIFGHLVHGQSSLNGKANPLACAALAAA
jgi:hypothetical protein